MLTQLTIVILKWILLHCFCISRGTENAVTDSRFRSRSRDSDLFLLSNSPRFRTPCSQTLMGIYGLLCGGGGGGWGLGRGGGRGRGTHAHRQPTMDTRVTQKCPYVLSPEPIHIPSIGRNPTQPPRHTTPYLIVR